MKNPLIITIGREYGSGGREIGKALAEKLGVRMPICECVSDILFCGKDPAAALTELMLRDRRSEF